MRTLPTVLLWATLVGCRAVPDRDVNSAGAAESTDAPPTASVSPVIVEHSGQAASGTPGAAPAVTPEEPAAPEKPAASADKPATGTEKPAAVPVKPAAAASTGSGAPATPSPAPTAVSASGPAPQGPPCSSASFELDAVERACRSGGRNAARDLMKEAVSRAKAQGAALNCASCHVDTRDYGLRPNAVADLRPLL